MKFLNTEFFPINEDKTVTVTVKMIADPKASDEVNMRNAAMALTFFANSHKQQSHSWVKEIEVKW